jgi:hypothetical protein
MATLISLLMAIQDEHLMREIREDTWKRVAKRPDLLNLLVNKWSISIAPELDQVTQLASPPPGGPPLPVRFRFPIAYEFAGDRMAESVITIAPDAVPYQLTAGVLAFEAWHPTQPQRRIIVRVLAARRAPDST